MSNNTDLMFTKTAHCLDVIEDISDIDSSSGSDSDSNDDEPYKIKFLSYLDSTTDKNQTGSKSYQLGVLSGLIACNRSLIDQKDRETPTHVFVNFKHQGQDMLGYMGQISKRSDDKQIWEMAGGNKWSFVYSMIDHSKIHTPLAEFCKAYGITGNVKAYIRFKTLRSDDKPIFMTSVKDGFWKDL